MTIVQIALIIYLCCFVCSWGGLWLIVRDCAKQLHKEGYAGTLNTSSFSLYTFLTCACPILNAFMAISVMCWYDRIVEQTKREIKENNMSEFEMLQRMLDREGGIYKVDTEEEFNDETGEDEEMNPAYDEEFLYPWI